MVSRRIDADDAELLDLARDLIRAYPHPYCGTASLAPGERDVVRRLRQLGEGVAVRERDALLAAARWRAEVAPTAQHRGRGWLGLRRWISSEAWRNGAPAAPANGTAPALRSAESARRDLEAAEALHRAALSQRAVRGDELPRDRLAALQNLREQLGMAPWEPIS